MANPTRRRPQATQPSSAASRGPPPREAGTEGSTRGGSDSAAPRPGQRRRRAATARPVTATALSPSSGGVGTTSGPDACRMSAARSCRGDGLQPVRKGSARPSDRRRSRRLRKPPAVVYWASGPSVSHPPGSRPPGVDSPRSDLAPGRSPRTGRRRLADGGLLRWSTVDGRRTREKCSCQPRVTCEMRIRAGQAVPARHALDPGVSDTPACRGDTPYSVGESTSRDTTTVPVAVVATSGSVEHLRPDGPGPAGRGRRPPPRSRGRGCGCRPGTSRRHLEHVAGLDRCPELHVGVGREQALVAVGADAHLGGDVAEQAQRRTRRRRGCRRSGRASTARTGGA